MIGSFPMCAPHCHHENFDRATVPDRRPSNVAVRSGQCLDWGGLGMPIIGGCAVVPGRRRSNDARPVKLNAGLEGRIGGTQRRSSARLGLGRADWARHPTRGLDWEWRRLGHAPYADHRPSAVLTNDDREHPGWAFADEQTCSHHTIVLIDGDIRTSRRIYGTVRMPNLSAHGVRV